MMWQKARSMFSDRPEVPEMSEHAHKVWKRAIRKYRLERYKQAVHHATMASHAPRKRLARSKSLDRMSVLCVNEGIELDVVVALDDSIELQFRAARASLSRRPSRRRRPSALADAARPPAAVPPPRTRPPPPSLRLFAVRPATDAAARAPRKTPTLVGCVLIAWAVVPLGYHTSVMNAAAATAIPGVAPNAWAACVAAMAPAVLSARRRRRAASAFAGATRSARARARARARAPPALGDS